MPLVDHYLDTPGVPPALMAGTVPYGKLPTANWARYRQPYLDRHGRACLAVNSLDGEWTKQDAKGGESKPLVKAYLINDLLNRGVPLPVTANAATLTKEAWQELSRRVQLAARDRLRLVEDLSMAVPLGGFDAYRKMTYEYQAMSDPGSAYVDMDALTDGTADTPQFITRSVPLPLTHSDFGYSDRELEVSRSGNMPFDMAMGEAAARRVGESLEDQAIGNVTGVTYGTQSSGAGAHTGTSTVYGLRTFAQRLTKTNFTAPSGGGWVPSTTVNELLTAIEQLRAQKFYGPFHLYHGTDWDQYLDRDYYHAITSGAVAPVRTLRERLSAIGDITMIRRLDRLTTTFTLFLLQMSSDVVQLINGMDTTVIQWQDKGGLAHRWKVMAIRVPLFRSDYSSQTGLLHGSTS